VYRFSGQSHAKCFSACCRSFWIDSLSLFCSLNPWINTSAFFPYSRAYIHKHKNIKGVYTNNKKENLISKLIDSFNFQFNLVV